MLNLKITIIVKLINFYKKMIKKLLIFLNKILFWSRRLKNLMKIDKLINNLCKTNCKNNNINKNIKNKIFLIKNLKIIIILKFKK